MKQVKLLTFSLAFMLWSAQSWAQTVFINEIHYDNAGTDEGEAVEILGPAGTNLSGWSIVAYNGNGGASYLTVDLTGNIISDQVAGYGTVQILISGLQNGAPDGIALVNNGALVQFLTYEGSFSATNGPAAGVMGTDIGVEESGGAALGSSMQLIGTGTQYTDFTWVSGDLPSSFGAINTNQTIGEILVENVLIINEVDADQTGTDATEFVELFDGGLGNTALDGLVLVLFNGNGDLSYGAYDLDGFSTDADGYFVIGSASVSNVDLVAFTTNGLQNGADAVALYTGDAADFADGTVITTDGLIDALVYDTSDADDLELLVLLNAGQTQIDENANNNAIGESMQRLPNGSGGARNTSTYGLLPPTPGAENGEALPVTLIHDIQGNGLASPLAGNAVVIEGIVVGDFQSTNVQGFYVQEEDADADTDELTSEGIFVFAPGAIAVAEGDLVRVEGIATEFFELTELTGVSSIEILASNQALPTALQVNLPLPDGDFLERFEGMLVSFPQTLTVTNNFLLGRGGELGLSFGDRLFQPTHVVNPGPEAQALSAANDLNYIIIDDASTAQNPDPTLFPTGGLSFGNTARGGDEVSDIQGVLTYNFSGFSLSGVSTNAYRVYTTQEPVFMSANPRMEAPEETGGNFKVASFNVLNYFNGDGLGGGFPTARGANTALEFERQRVKIINAILALDAAVVGLIEIENDGYGANSAIQDLVNGLNTEAGAGTYALIDPGIPQIGTDEIAVGFIYQPALAQPNGIAAILDSGVDPTFNDALNRPALLQNFEDIASGNSINVVVNHFKSKGSNCNDFGDIDLGDGQGNCNLTRTDAAVALANWLETDPTGQNSPYNLIIGDLNSYAQEDPIVALEELGYTDLLNQLNGSSEYSFQFDGLWGYLDYAMANDALLDLVTGATVWKLNADEPAVLDYNVEFKSANQVEIFYNESAFRSSDHDPVLVGFDFAPIVGQCEDYRYYLADVNAELTTNIYNMEITGSSASLSLIASSDIEVHIAFNEIDHLIYAVSKFDGSYRTLDPATGVWGANTLLGTAVQQIVGAAINADGKLLISSQSANTIYEVSLDDQTVSVYDSYSPTLGGDIAFGNDGALYHVTREAGGALLLSIPQEVGTDVMLGSVPAIVTGLANTASGQLIVSSLNANSLAVRNYDGSIGSEIALTLDGAPFSTFNGDLASGCADDASSDGDEDSEVEEFGSDTFGNVSTDRSGSTLTSYPNPTSAASQVVFTAAGNGRTLLEVYDMNGRNVATLFNQEAEAGQEYRVDFEGAYLPNGVYLYRLTTANEVIIDKFMIAK